MADSVWVRNGVLRRQSITSALWGHISDSEVVLLLF
jgi:hypothetical protein